ncbi:hypothetical protein VTJ49DRAFT_6133 [Mycothermus thermophilus]|uniref:Purine-cytosine permease n=1 Tax=Humicola insolens TaxID=85995 RepID=A0ABR3VJJ3_HUMIN
MSSTIPTDLEAPPPKGGPRVSESQESPQPQQPQAKPSGWKKFLASLTPEEGEVYRAERAGKPKWYRRLLDAGFEENGIKPVPIEERTSTQYSNLFTVFFTCLCCLLPIPTGMLATLNMGMSLRDASLTILFFALLTCIPPAFMGLGGMETGLRQLIQARYSFGLYLVTIPLFFNAATLTGFSLLSSIVGGQALAALDPDRIPVDVGIIVTCVISFAVSLLGQRAVHVWERWTWIPNLIAIVIAVGCGGKHLHLQTEAPPATPAKVMTLGALVAGYFITFGGAVSDYSIYHNPKKASRLRVFLNMYLGFLLPSVPLLILGAAIGGAVPNQPAWHAAYQTTGIGGVMAEMLSPVLGFGFSRFVLLLLALSILGNVTVSMYSIALNLQMLLPAFARVPRVVFILVAMAMMAPMAMLAAREWEESLANFLAVIGYWAGCFDAVVIEELVVFRRMDYGSYDHGIWNVGRKLPPGFAAVGASLASLGLVVPGMAAPWYTGPIAKVTGDIGFEMAFVVTAVMYLPLRWLEIRWRGSL